MNAHQIRNILDTEANHLKFKANNPYAGNALQSFATTATDAELIRFREIIMGTEPRDWWSDPIKPVDGSEDGGDWMNGDM